MYVMETGLVSWRHFFRQIKFFKAIFVGYLVTISDQPFRDVLSSLSLKFTYTKILIESYIVVYHILILVLPLILDFWPKRIGPVK